MLKTNYSKLHNRKMTLIWVKISDIHRTMQSFGGFRKVFFIKAILFTFSLQVLNPGPSKGSVSKGSKIWLKSQAVSSQTHRFNNHTFLNYGEGFCCFGLGFCCYCFVCLLRQEFSVQAGCPETHSIHQLAFNSRELHLPLPPKRWD